jgi:hypothetical protein
MYLSLDILYFTFWNLFQFKIFKEKNEKYDRRTSLVLIIITLFRTVNFWVRVMIFNATFNNISVISWRSGLLVEETGVPGENHRPAVSHFIA